MRGQLFDFLNLAACGGIFFDRIDRINKIFLYVLYLPAGRQVLKILSIPGPDLACQDVVMESEALISSENSCISTSRRARAGWLSMTEFYRSCFRNITLTTACYDHVASGRAWWLPEQLRMISHNVRIIAISSQSGNFGPLQQRLTILSPLNLPRVYLCCKHLRDSPLP